MTQLPSSSSALAPLVPDKLFEDAELLSLQSRAVAYLTAGVPVHLRGPAGMGKTTLAMRIAERLSRPVSFLTGDKWLSREDMIGREVGRSTRQTVDNYINRVRRTESQERVDWKDAILTDAMQNGHTLVYDEFTRAPPQANAALLPVLEERVLIFHDSRAGRQRLVSHPEFRVILTSNPKEYVGVEHAPDALLDRVVTFDLDSISEDTERGIVATRTGLSADNASMLVALVRSLRRLTPDLPSSVRTSLLIGRLVAAQNLEVSLQDSNFLQICIDVLRSRHGPKHAGSDSFEELLKKALKSLPNKPQSSMRIAS